MTIIGLDEYSDEPPGKLHHQMWTEEANPAMLKPDESFRLNDPAGTRLWRVPTNNRSPKKQHFQVKVQSKQAAALVCSVFCAATCDIHFMNFVITGRLL